MQVLTYNIKAYTANSTATLQARVKCICSITHSCITAYQKLSRILHAIALTWLLALTPQLAHADFRKALDAYIARDGDTMLKEVKDAVKNKNDDGIILFLSILKQYPKTWRPTLNESQQIELFECLERVTTQSSLQSQYRLAVIPRRENNPPPIPTGAEKNRESWYDARKQEKLKEYQDEITRLEPVANKGYAPAALQIHADYAYNSTKSNTDQDNAMKWLKKAAELGNAQAAYLLGMKYLHVVDEMYGCTSSGKKPPNCQLPKDEVKGWYWMQEAAKHANEPSMMVSALDELALNMGNLYMQSVAGNKPDYEQAYLWYQRMPPSPTIDTSPVWSKLEELHKLGQLKRLNPALDKTWGNASTWREAVKSEQVIKALQSSPSKLPRLMREEAQKNNSAKPIFTMATVRWYQPNASYAGIVLDVYDDGRVNLLIGDAGFSENNDELWMRVEPAQVKTFVDEVQNLKLENRPWIWPSCVGCVENRTDFVTFNYSGEAKIVEIASATFANKKTSHPEVRELLKIVEKYYPLSKLVCDADVGEGRSACYQIYQDILKPTKNREKS